MRATLRLSLLLAALGAAPAASQAPDAILTLGNGYDISPNQVYGRFNGWDAKLDLYVPHDTTSSHPVLIYIHGGGWMAGNKEESAFELLPAGSAMRSDGLARCSIASRSPEPLPRSRWSASAARP